MRRIIAFLVVAWAASALAVEDGDLARSSLGPDLPLIAHWTFDEPSGNLCHDASGLGNDALLVPPVPGLERSRGVHGPGLSLQGAHAIRTRLKLDLPQWRAITFSAWVRPSDLSGFREVFRQECPNRLLFSFQNGGTILSLGLNIGGYVECDAALPPGRAMDGFWHHCAATFDGSSMRVYLDGKEIAALARPGMISVSPEVPAFIGSSGGGSEHFQGNLDDLRLYSAALSPEQVAGLYQLGTRALRDLAREMEAAIDPIYPAGLPFAETLTACRRKIAEQGRDLGPDLALALQGRLKENFQIQCAQFARWTGRPSRAYLTDPDPEAEALLAGRLMDLLLEYRPITEHQWENASPEDRLQWQEADRIQKRFDALQARGEGARFSPEWIEVMMAAGPLINFRPALNEPVAPYGKPSTPATRSLTPAQGRAALEHDWIHQADGPPTPLRIREEIRWTRAIIGRIQAAHAAPPDFSADLAALDVLERQATALKVPDTNLYFQVRAAKRSIMFKNPAIDFDQVLFVDMPFPQGSEWRHETRHRLGYMAVPGGRLLKLKGLRPDGQLTQLMPRESLHGSFWRPDLSWDGRNVLFCFKPHNEKSFHLYEINVDGSGLRQLTDGPFDDLDPIYLPDDGHIIFSTTRGHTYVRCMPPTSAFVLARSERDGKNIFLISANNEPDYLPSVMNDGRVLYTRWEYTDKPLWRAQKLWTVNPDGSQVLMFWGNQSVWPDLMKDARSIPGSRRVMFTGSAHHDWFSGSVGIIDSDQGFNFPWGLTKVTADTPWPECGNGPVDPVESDRYHANGFYDAYYSPYPLSEQDFLVSASRAGKFVLYLMDTEGNRELVYEGAHHIFHAQPLKPRPKPPVVLDRTTWPSRQDRDQPAQGVIFSSNIDEGAPPELRGLARFLRVLSIDHKTYTYWYKRPYISTGPVVSAVQSEGVKRLIGTVPIEADGSVSFYAPAGVPLHFQLLDENQRALQTMRSFVNVMPGEQRGCVGCHESHGRAPDARGKPLALSRAPREITPPPWPDHTISYPRYVRPVLDRYCSDCHEGEGKARSVLDLTERPSEPVFTEPYLTLIGRPSWGTPYQPPADPSPGFGLAGCLMVEGYSTIDPQAYATPPPMSALSYRSKLIEMCASGRHYEVKVDELNLLRLIAWVDAMCPYRGEEEIREIPDPVFQGVDWLSVRPKIATAPRVTRPGPVD